MFEDMIARSVPGYADNLTLLLITAQRHAPTGRIYDLGASLGTASTALAAHLPNAEIIAVDNAPAMVARGQALLDDTNARRAAQNKPPLNITWRTADINDFALEPCSLVVLRYTLQFMPLDARDALMAKIFGALTPGGALFLAEKMQHNKQHDTLNGTADDKPNNNASDDRNHDADAALQAYYDAYKALQGYSATEIARKRDALEDYLRPEPITAHSHRLHSAGFTRITCLQQYLAFTTLIATKPTA